MIKFFVHHIVLALVLFLINCASMFSENKYTYNITSNPPNVEVTAQDALLIIGKYKTPCKIDVHMKRETILKFEASGYNEKYIPLERGINRWFWLSLLAGWPGIIIDYATGSMYKPIDNKTEINVELEPSTAQVEKKAKK